MEPQSHWKHYGHYHLVELIFDGNKVIYKDWWDSGHDPNRTELTVAEFLGGELHDTIREEMAIDILREASETVDRLTTGGPGVAEPPA